MTLNQFKHRIRILTEADPDNPLLAKAKEAGHSVLGIAFLEQAEQWMQNNPKAETVITSLDEQSQGQIRALWAQRATLFAEMNKLSNKLADFDTNDNDGRKKTSSAINAIWSQIVRVKSEISFLEGGGKPKPAKTENIESPYLLYKKKISLTANRSVVRKKLKGMGHVKAGHQLYHERMSLEQKELTLTSEIERINKILANAE